MNKRVFKFNWIYRSREGLLYGLKFKPGMIVSNTKDNLLSPTVTQLFILKSLTGENPKLIKETDKSLKFIKQNILYHVTDLMKEDSK